LDLFQLVLTLSLQRRGVEIGPTKREKMKNFMALKDKIVKTE